MTDDFYDLLEIPPDASQDEIKDAYREQVRVYHPDLNDDDRARAQFTAIKTAYDILGDPVERQAYDRLGHEEYVAKRTSGLPSPDVWQSDDEDDSSDTELRYSESETASASASAASSASAGSATAGRSSSASSGGGRSTAGTSATSTGTGNGASSASGTAGSKTSGRTGGSRSEAAAGTGRSRGAGSRSSSGSGSGTGTGNPLARWWRRQNFSLPLLWFSLLVYAAGLGHFGLANADALAALSAQLRTIGPDPAGVWALLSESRHGLETAVEFALAVEFVAPPLEQALWYGGLAGVVALTLGGLFAVRVAKREDTWGPVTIDETIVVAAALTTATTLAGGPLLAGAVLMPFLFGVVVRHTRRGPGWKPSYLYVCPVLAPLAGFGAAAVGVASLPVDLAAFAILPLIGGVALPVRATIKIHLGR